MLVLQGNAMSTVSASRKIWCLVRGTGRGAHGTSGRVPEICDEWKGDCIYCFVSNRGSLRRGWFVASLVERKDFLLDAAKILNSLMYRLCTYRAKSLSRHNHNGAGTTV